VAYKSLSLVDPHSARIKFRNKYSEYHYNSYDIKQVVNILSLSLLLFFIVASFGFVRYLTGEQSCRPICR